MRSRPRRPPLVPYTTLFRSQRGAVAVLLLDDDDAERSDAEAAIVAQAIMRSEEHTSELQSRGHLVCRLLLEKKKQPDAETEYETASSGLRAARPVYHSQNTC